MMKKNINILNIAIGILVFLVLILIILLVNRNNTSVTIPKLVIVDERVEVSKNNSVFLEIYVENIVNPLILWTSSDSEIASVSSSGVVTAHKEGIAIVTAEYKDSDGRRYSDSCFISVIKSSDVLVTGVSFLSDNLVISVGSQFKLDTVISPLEASFENIVYSSDNEIIVEVDKTTGLITAKEVGGATIKVTIDGEYSDEININVVAESGISEYITIPNQISFESTSLKMNVGDISVLNYYVLPSEASDKYLTWESSNPSIVSVSNGVVNAIKSGEAVITVTTLNGISAKIKISVTLAKIDVIAVSLTAVKTELKKGETLQLSYQVYPVDATNKNVSFTSSNKNVATVSETGLVTAKSSGTTNISITTVDGNFTKTVSITVTSSSSGGGSSAICDDGYGSKPNNVCTGSPTITLNGTTLYDMSKIDINVGETIILRVNLPTNNGEVTLLTRTTADGEDGWRDYLTAYSSPFVNRYDCSTAIKTSSYEWIITGKKSTGRYVELSQTAEIITTKCSFVKPMISVLVRVK